MKNLLKFMSILVLTSFIISCEGEDGPAGPAGLQGEQGPQGDQGDPGTANVIYSDWIPNGFAQGGGLNQKFFTLADAQEITDLGVNLDTSMVMVYGRGEDVFLAIGQEIVPLPYELRSIEQLYTFMIDDGRIRAFGSVRNGNSNDFDLFDDYRYVIIPGGQAAGRSAQDLSKMSYEEVVALLNIKE